MNDKHLDLRALRDVVRSLDDGLEVVRNTEWFNAQDVKVRNTLIAGVHQKARQVCGDTVVFIDDARALLVKPEQRNA
jgi:hypothetical protein